MAIFQRCQPWLGTYVQITVHADHPALAHRGMDAAFKRIERLQKLLSFHDSDSEISRLNADAFDRPIRVSPETWNVLRSATRLSKISDGVFDVTVAPILQKWGYLPRTKTRLSMKDKPDYRDIEFRRHRFVSFRKRLRIDLGGIAKGFAVDQAVGVLRRNNIIAGVVNAGGDVRVFGEKKWSIALRHPQFPSRTLSFLRIKDGAVATSGTYFSRKKYKGQWISPIVRSKNEQPFRKNKNITVIANTCMAADGLTKIVALAPKNAEGILNQFSSKAFVTSANGSIRGLNQ